MVDRLPRPRRVFGPGPASGTTDMGKSLSRLLQIPFGLTDRDTGQVWYFSGNDRASGLFPAAPRLAWNSEPPAGGLVRPTVYAAGSEPTLGSSGLRIFVRGGRLGFETKDTHVYEGPRWTAPHIVTWYSIRYELRVPAGGLPTPPRLAFETTPDW